MHNSYRLMAVDMDGTLLNSHKKIMPETLEDISRAVSSGKEIALCTGRGIREIDEYLEELKQVRYAVLLSGAHVYDQWAGKTVFFGGIGEEEAKRVVDVCERYDGMIQFMTEHASYVRGDQISQMKDYHMEAYQPMFERVMIRMDDVRKTLAGIDPPGKMLIYFHTVEDRQKGLEELKKLPLELIFQEETSLEITAKGVDKGTGLRVLADHLGIPMDQVIAVGDSGNARTMLAAAGFPIAVANASEEIKMMARAVTADNDNNGVGEAIRSYMKEADE